MTVDGKKKDGKKDDGSERKPFSRETYFYYYYYLPKNDLKTQMISRKRAARWKPENEKKRKIRSEKTKCSRRISKALTRKNCHEKPLVVCKNETAIVKIPTSSK